MDVVLRVVVGVLLVAHGLVHLLYLAPDVSQFSLERSWLVPEAGRRTAGYVLIGATIVGFVGAGGIGHDLFTSIQLLYFSDAGAILLIIVATIMLIDILSEAFRHSAIGRAAFAR